MKGYFLYNELFTKRFPTYLILGCFFIWPFSFVIAQEQGFLRWVDDSDELNALFSEKSILGEYNNISNDTWIEYYRKDGQLIYKYNNCYYRGTWKIQETNPKACFSYVDAQQQSGYRTSCFYIGLTAGRQIVFAISTKDTATNNPSEYNYPSLSELSFIARSTNVEFGNFYNLPINDATITDGFCTNFISRKVTWLYFIPP